MSMNSDSLLAGCLVRFAAGAIDTTNTRRLRGVTTLLRNGAGDTTVTIGGGLSGDINDTMPIVTPIVAAGADATFTVQPVDDNNFRIRFLVAGVATDVDFWFRLDKVR